MAALEVVTSTLGKRTERSRSKRKRGSGGGGGNGGGKARTPVGEGSVSPSAPILSFCFRAQSSSRHPHPEYKYQYQYKYLCKWFFLTISGDDLIEEEHRRTRTRRRRSKGEGGGGGDEEEVNIAFHHDLRHEGERQRTLRPIQVLEDSFSVPGTSSAALGSTIYSIGGVRRRKHGGPGPGRRFCRKVQCFDAKRPEEGWKRAPPLINPRSGAKVVYLDGKLFVFGGRSRYRGNWTEFFDPNQCDGRGRWAALPPPKCPPFRLPHTKWMFVLPQEEEKRILVGSHSSTFVLRFDVTTMSWASPSKCGPGSYFPRWSGRTEPVLVRNTLYWIDDDGLNAYDLKTNMFYSGPIKDFRIRSHLDSTDGSDTRTPLLHLAGPYFCLLWVAPEVEGLYSASNYLLHCTIFMVSSGSCSKSPLIASVLFCHSYRLDEHLNFIDGLLLL